MKKYVLFENDGEIDPNSIKFMGCSTKNGTDTIGKFGTGLKYAIAALLRNWVHIVIFSGETKIEFDTTTKMIWGKDFQQILINWEETGLTTNLGVEWKLWQGFREFYANCLDEYGTRYDWEKDLKWEEWYTRVFIESTDEIQQTFDYFKFDGWKQVGHGLFFTEKEAISPVKLFKEGFLVYEGSKDELSLFDYRIDQVEINEARLIENNWYAFNYVGRIIAKMDFESVNKIIDSGEYILCSSYDTLWDGWNQAQQSRGWDLKTNSSDLNVQLKKLRATTDDKYRYYGGYHGESVSLITIDFIWEFNINGEFFKTYTAAFKGDNKFDFNLNKQEIYINTKNVDEQKKIICIITELIENDRKEKSEFIIELLERIYSNVS